MKKGSKTLRAMLCGALAALVLAGCGGGGGSSSTPAQQTSRPQPSRQQAAQTLTVDFINETGYTLYNMYVDPAEAGSFTVDVLGDEVLADGETLQLTMDASSLDEYDIHCVDADDFTYTFWDVELYDGSEVVIDMYGELTAYVTHADGTQLSYAGEMAGGEVPIDNPDPATATGHNTQGAFSFTVYNESDYDIYAIYVGVANASSEHDIDILPAVLSAWDYADVSGNATSGDWGHTDWTLYIVDVDGDTSHSFDVFNPWSLKYVEVSWDSAGGGYLCSFYY